MFTMNAEVLIESFASSMVHRRGCVFSSPRDTVARRRSRAGDWPLDPLLDGEGGRLPRLSNSSASPASTPTPSPGCGAGCRKVRTYAVVANAASAMQHPTSRAAWADTSSLPSFAVKTPEAPKRPIGSSLAVFVSTVAFWSASVLRITRDAAAKLEADAAMPPALAASACTARPAKTARTRNSCRRGQQARSIGDGMQRTGCTGACG
mmetsp:Transcript_102789/g.290664  ORF Transcript_102789/g.290664 Transcript_102789/m.290664 type:complete len:207 (+) Transcript_102789:342-962(+)